MARAAISPRIAAVAPEEEGAVGHRKAVTPSRRSPADPTGLAFLTFLRQTLTSDTHTHQQARQRERPGRRAMPSRGKHVAAGNTHTHNNDESSRVTVKRAARRMAAGTR